MIITEKEKFRTDEKVMVKCDFKSSLKCKGTYEKVFRNILKGRQNNNGKDRCCYCFNTLTKTGSNNYNYKYFKDESFFENIDSEFKAYMLGWIAGDGHLKKDGLYFSIHPIDIDILLLFKEQCKSNAPIKYDSRDNTVQWKLNSVKIVNDILNILELEKPGKKFDKIKIPSSFKEDLIWPFIRGLFDSDGHVATLNAKNTSPLCSLCTVSKEMQKNLTELLSKHNIKCVKPNDYSQIQILGKNCNLFLDKIYDHANFYLHRKKTLWKIWSTWKPFYGTIFKPRKVREYYKPISEEHKEKIRESNRKRKGIKYVRNSLLCDRY